MYIKDEKSTLPKSIKELKGFEKIALDQGEEKQISFMIDKSMLSYFNEIKGFWVAEPGIFEVTIGASATDLRGSAGFILK